MPGKEPQPNPAVLTSDLIRGDAWVRSDGERMSPGFALWAQPRLRMSPGLRPLGSAQATHVPRASPFGLSPGYEVNRGYGA